MKRNLLTFFIILLLPLSVLAQQNAAPLNMRPGLLPGQFGHSFQNIQEWLWVNIFTLNTTGKQERKLELSTKRLAEIQKLAANQRPNAKDLRRVVEKYMETLIDSEDMAEKIVILDGAQLPLAENFEKISRAQQEVLYSLLAASSREDYHDLLRATNAARSDNEAIFKFMVKNYQFNAADIARYGSIVSEQTHDLQQFAAKLPNFPADKLAAVYDDSIAMSKYQSVGLNAQAYDALKQTTDVVIGALLPK